MTNVNVRSLRSLRSLRSEAGTKRRSHRKSRMGCKECKQRHAKCDEQRPVCVNCSTTNRRCSYLDQQPNHITRHDITSHDDDVRRETSLRGTSSPPSTNSTSPASFAAILGAAFDARDEDTNAPPDQHAPMMFNMSHLALLHHLETEILGPLDASLVSDENQAGSFAKLMLRSAIATPYLMDELLAFSALHMSTLQSDPADKAQYLHQAAELQMRALGLFNATSPQLHDGNCLSMFYFASILGLHTLFDAASSCGDFVDFLDKYIQYISLHRGVRSITRKSWHVIRHTEMKSILDPIERIDQLQQQLQSQPTDCAASNECSRLMSLLAESADRLGPAHFRAYSEAVSVLQWVFGQHQTLPRSMCMHITLAWPVLLSAEYIDLLKQRRPEALVVLTHWAVLLHNDRDFWVFGGVGRFLIESISRYLGPYWDEWVALPKQALVDDI